MIDDVHFQNLSGHLRRGEHNHWIWQSFDRFDVHTGAVLDVVCDVCGVYLYKDGLQVWHEDVTKWW